MSVFRKLNKMLLVSLFDFASNSKDILNRYKREKKNWDIHLENTKQFIIDSTKEQSGTLMVLGSGRLLDLPIDKLSKQFNKIYLVDFIHSKETKRHVGKFENIELIAADITGGMLESAYKLKKNNGQFFSYTNYFNKCNFTTNVNPDFVISLNSINQIDLILTDYLKRKTDVSAKEIKQLRKNIQQKHLDFIKRFNHCLIASIEEEWYNDEDKLIGIKPTVFVDFSEYKTQKKWLWKFDTSTTNYNDRKTYFNIIAVTNSSF